MSKDQKKFMLMGLLNFPVFALGLVIYYLCSKSASWSNFLPQYIGMAIGNTIVYVIIVLGSSIPKKKQ